MAATIIDGKTLAERLRARVREEAARLAASHVTPLLAVVLVVGFGQADNERERECA